eukprot:335189_1
MTHVSIILNLVLVHVISIDYDNNRYRVFWNVDEGKTPVIDVTQFDILPMNWTQTGKGCSNPHCVWWNEGIWPTINTSTTPWTPINGGVPQAGNLSIHLNYIEQHLPQWIPNINWNGNAVIDFEEWTSIWNYMSGSVYQNYSIQLAQQQYPNYNSSQIEAIAKNEFESAATKWFVETLKTCTSIRPKARWGYYGFPRNNWWPCTGTDADMKCGYQDPTQGPIYRNYSDQQIPIWQVSGALYPSIYLQPAPYTYYHSLAFLNSTITESLRCAKNGNITGNLVYPFMWQKYHNGTTLLSPQDLNISVKNPYDLGAQGLIIWGAWDTAANNSMWNYLNETTGPVVYSVVEYVNECSQKFCSCHGRCASLSSNVCECDTGYIGSDCNITDIY